jgi:hypothetical protein
MIQDVSGQTLEEAERKAKDIARQRAVDAGAVESSVVIAEIESLPVTYVANQLRTIVKAVGELDITTEAQKVVDSDELDATDEEEDVKGVLTEVVEEQTVNPETYVPMIVKNEATGVREWLISETDIDFLSKGKLRNNNS